MSHPAGGKQATPKDGWVGLASQGRGDERVLGRLSRRPHATSLWSLAEAFSKGIFGHQANAQDKGKRKRTEG